MPKTHFKHTLFTEFARVGKALSHANRLELLEIIAQGSQNVDELAKISGLSVANTSQHLQHLRRAGLVIAQKQGLKVYYQLSGNDVIELITTLRNVAQHHIAEVDHLINGVLGAKDELEAIQRDELVERIKHGTVTVIDVRPATEYAAGHVSGAINVPLKELEGKLNEFPKGQEVIAYCRGPHCVLAFDAVSKLRQSGINARRMQDGFPEWANANLPVTGRKSS